MEGGREKREGGRKKNRVRKKEREKWIGRKVGREKERE